MFVYLHQNLVQNHLAFWDEGEVIKDNVIFEWSLNESKQSQNNWFRVILF